MTPEPQQIWTISSKRLFDKDPLSWYFRYRCNLEALEQSDALQRGNDFHSAAADVYANEEADTVEGLGYAQWVEELEDFRAIQIEQPILIPLSRLYDFADRRIPAKVRDSEVLEGTYFGGVMDMVGESLRTGKTFIIDHKNVQRFYPYPYLFATEQLGLYQVARIIKGLPVDGVALSRVKSRVDVRPIHYENYIQRYLKLTHDYQISKANLKAAIKNIYKENIYNKDIGIPSSAFVTQKIITPSTRSVRIALREPRKKGYAALKGLVKYNQDGYRTVSIQNKKGVLLHVEREFYVIPPEELRNIVIDFLLYVEDASTRTEFRRSPGIYASPYDKLSVALRQDIHLELPPVEDFGLRVREPNQEVLEALKRVQTVGEGD